MKVLKINLKQPSAHYRNPKIFQTDYVATLPLPCATTIAGMITYVCGRRVSEEIKIGITGTYKYKETEFSRGEDVNYWSEYEKFASKADKDNYQKNNKLIGYFKENIIGNLIFIYEVLKEVELNIYIKCSNKEDFNMIYNSFKHPGVYINLGRKEDFAVSKNKGDIIEIVEVKTQKIKSIRDAVANKLKVKNTYISIDLNKSEKYEDILNEGCLMTLPKTYKSLKANKEDRIPVFGHYIYIGENGIYPEDIELNVVETAEERDVFTWL